jgi:hypothetical protein
VMGKVTGNETFVAPYIRSVPLSKPVNTSRLVNTRTTQSPRSEPASRIGRGRARHAPRERLCGDCLLQGRACAAHPNRRCCLCRPGASLDRKVGRAGGQ